MSNNTSKEEIYRRGIKAVSEIFDYKDLSGEDDKVLILSTLASVNAAVFEALFPYDDAETRVKNFRNNFLGIVTDCIKDGEAR